HLPRLEAAPTAWRSPVVSSAGLRPCCARAAGWASSTTTRTAPRCAGCWRRPGSARSRSTPTWRAGRGLPRRSVSGVAKRSLRSSFDRLHRMMLYDCTRVAERDRGLAAAIEAVQRGDLVVLPTDTVYGIGADA